MESIKKSSFGNSSEIEIESKVHPVVYVFNFMPILFTIPLITGGLVGVAILIWLLCATLIVRNATTRWQLSKTHLIIKSGILPWYKTNLEIPIEEIYEALYYPGLFSFIGYATIKVRRTEGTTSAFSSRYMTNPQDLTGTINTWVKSLALQKEGKGRADNNAAKPMISEEIIRLSKLKEDGVLTEDEFIEAKQRLLRS